MHVKLTCPQCRAALKMAQAPAPGKVVTCPSCQLKFAAMPVAQPESAQRSSLALWIMVALVLAASAGGIIWHNLGNREQDTGLIAENSPAPEPEAKAGNPETSQPP